MTTSLRELLGRSARALGLTQEGLAKALGASRRTGQRWFAGDTRPKLRQLVALARLVAVRDRALGEELARRAGAVLEPPAPQGPPIGLRMDSIVGAAADVANVAPQTMRRALAAALVRARELDVAPTSLEPLLRAAPPP
ncbi:MAG TPA: helix-turn-helix transcriptional regulator [Labilithrix sp.]